MTPSYYLWLQSIALEDAGAITTGAFGALCALMFWLFQFAPPAWQRWIYTAWGLWFTLLMIWMVASGVQRAIACGAGL